MNKLVFLPFVLSLALLAEETPTPPQLLTRERTVYVPYEKLKETFDKEGRGVFLPYEEFVKLWNLGQPKPIIPEDIKAPADAVISGGNYTGVAGESAVRFEVTYKLRALNKGWSEIALPLKNVAVETVNVTGPLTPDPSPLSGARGEQTALFIAKNDGYAVLLPKPGEYTLTLAFSAHIDARPGERKIEFGIPPTAVSRLELTLPEKNVRVDVQPAMAATTRSLEGDTTKLLAFVGNAASVAVTWMPPAGKAVTAKGEALVIAAQSMYVELGERVLRLDTTLDYKIERNEEDTFHIRPPADMRLLSVRGNNIREWSVDKDSGVLEVRLHAPAKDTYELALRFERVLEKTPDKLDVPFPAALGALREDGFVTLAHEPGLRLRIAKAEGLSQIDPRELPEALKRPNLLAGFRYLAQPLALSLNVETILPQIQSAATTVLSVGPEEDTLAGWVDFQVAKVGIFTAKLRFENAWEVVSVGDAQNEAVEDFQTAADGAFKTLTVNFKSRALGSFRLPFKLSRSGHAPLPSPLPPAGGGVGERGAPSEIVLAPVQVLDTQQDKGLFGISAPKAFKLTTLDRAKMASANVQQLVATGLLAQLGGDFELPLVYSYAQQPASVKVALERRVTEIHVTGYHTITVSEAGLDVADKLEYAIEFAGVDKVQFSLPSALDDKLLDVKCAGFKEKKKVGEKEGRSTWEISLQDKVLGTLPVFINYKDNLKNLEAEKAQDVAIADVHAEDVKAQQGFIAVRKESALEIEPRSALETLEGGNLPAEMRASNTYLAFRYFQPEHALVLKLTRHVPVEVSNTVVDLIRATFVVSEENNLSVQAELWVENARGEQYLELALPKGAAIRALAVNNVPTAPLQRSGGTSADVRERTLIKLAASTRPFPVQLVYAVPLGGTGAPARDEKMGWAGSLDVKAPEVLGSPLPPVNKIEADLYVPDEYAYLGFTGTLHFRNDAGERSNTLVWLTGLARSRPDAIEIQRADTSRFPSPPPLLGAFTTQGRVFHFQTLAPLGEISLRYCDRKFFWLLDALLLALSVALGWYVSHRKWLARALTCVIFIAAPLCLGWLLTSDAGEWPAAWLVGGVLLALLFGADFVREKWRARKVAEEPNELLEDL